MIHTNARSSTGTRIDLCVFGSLENTAEVVEETLAMCQEVRVAGPP